MQLHRPLLVVLAVALPALRALAQDDSVCSSLDNLTVTVSPDGGGTCSITQVGSKYSIDMTRSTSGTGLVTFNVRGASTDWLHNVNVYNNNTSGGSVWVSIRGSASSTAHIRAADSVAK